MNKKLITIFKALEKLPNDIKYLIVKEVEGTFISESLRKIYYDKVFRNTDIFKLLYIHSVYFLNFLEEDVFIFLIYTKNNLTFSYITDTLLWIEKFIIIHNYYRNFSERVKRKCSEIMIMILKSINIEKLDTGYLFF